MHIFAAMRKAHGQVRFIGTLVRREARVAIDAKQRAPRCAWIGCKVRRDVIERTREIGDEAQCGLMRMGFVFFFVREAPVPIVVALEASEETKEVRSEIWRHGIKGRGAGWESKGAMSYELWATSFSLRSE